MCPGRTFTYLILIYQEFICSLVYGVWTAGRLIYTCVEFNKFSRLKQLLWAGDYIPPVMHSTHVVAFIQILCTEHTETVYRQGTARGKIHTVKNVVCYRTDNPAGTHFLPSPCEMYCLFYGRSNPITNYIIQCMKLWNANLDILSVNSNPGSLNRFLSPNLNPAQKALNPDSNPRFRFAHHEYEYFSCLPLFIFWKLSLTQKTIKRAYLLIPSWPVPSGLQLYFKMFYKIIEQFSIHSDKNNCPP